LLAHNPSPIYPAVLVGIITINQSKQVLEEYLNELSFLTFTAGGEVVKKITQKMDSPDPKLFLGKGKMEELASYIKRMEINSVIFDDELTPAQQLNIEKFLKCKIVDRTGLILDIFAQRAQTSYARNQVELAQYQYILPRLKGLWTHLERQKGGIGMRGPGETEIETDRRIVRNKITLLKKKLVTIDKQMSTQRGNRGSLVRVSLVGYTNVGKSTLMNSLTKADVFAEDKLFATLDTTVRKVVVKNMPFLLTDTVGFIRKLPTQLIDSFKSTLTEITEADLLIHVIDISHPNYQDHINSVNFILSEIEAHEKPILMVFNKTDKFFNDNEMIKDEYDIEYEDKSLDRTKLVLSKEYNNRAYFISALNKTDINKLKDELYKKVREIHVTRFPYNAFLYPDIN
jgi:GTP-binding protein HflX